LGAAAVTRTWVALVDAAVANADAQASLRDHEGQVVGRLAAWRRQSKPVKEARRVDPRIIDPAGPEAWLSLVWPARDALVAFDDLAVQHARRRVLADGRPPAAVTTVLIDDSQFAGAVTVRRGSDAVARLRDDPFARVAPARVLRVDAGIVGEMLLPVGPVIERHGSAQPWPWDRFA
jgi:hypothetical protein